MPTPPETPVPGENSEMLENIEAARSGKSGKAKTANAPGKSTMLDNIGRITSDEASEALRAEVNARLAKLGIKVEPKP